MSRLDAYSDDSRSLGYVTCECGRERSRCAQACDRCTYLDGTREPAFIIDALRGTDGLSLVELEPLTGMCNRSLRKSLKRLMQLGRVRRYWREAELTEVRRTLFQHGKQVTRAGGSGAWVYALDGKTLREWKVA